MALFAEFVLSAAAAKQFPTDNLPEIGLVGRSNVGKSSLINSLVRSNKLARTSNTPGRTQTLNYYRIWPDGKPKIGDPADPHDPDRFSLRGSALEAARQCGAFYFVDMPGYGFARVSESQKQSWRKLIEHYLLTRPNLAGVIQVVDLRHPPSKEDVAMWEWLSHYQKPRICIATKADKVPRTQRPAHLKQIVADLQLAGGPAPIPYSAEEALGRDEVWSWVLTASRDTVVSQ